MTAFEASVLAERAMAVERHLRRVADRRPVSPADFQPATDADVAAHGYETLDMARVHEAATRGPADVRAFMAAMREVVG